MKKPAWVSFFGWAFLFCVGLWFTGVVLHGFAGFGVWTSGLGFLALMAGGPCLFIWVVASLVNAIAQSHARTQAAAVAEAVRRTQGQAPPDNTQGPRRVMTSPLGLTGTERK